MKNKKAQIGNPIDSLESLIIPLIIVGVVCMIGLLIFAESREAIGKTSDISTIVVYNETITPIEGEYVTLDNICRPGITCDMVTNSTENDGSVVPSSWYTCTPKKGLKMDNESNALSADLNVTYTCKVGGVGYNSTFDTAAAIMEVPGWLSIIIIVVIGGLLIGLVSIFKR